MRPVALLVLIGAATALFAHEGEHHASGLDAAALWKVVTVVVLSVIAVGYTLGLARLWKSDAGKVTVRAWQTAAFYAGLLSVVVALLSRLDALSDILFSAHMAQHEILMLISAPLMVLGRPFIVMLWALPPDARARAGRAIRRPGIVTVWERVTGPFAVLIIHAVVLWAWHVPALFEAALRNETVHAFQHLGFFVTAALFWWALIHGRYGRVGYGIGVAYVFATAMHTQILGALLTFGGRVWYPTHAARTGASALDDQQLAGIVMWIPSGVIFVLIALALFAAWIGEAERRVQYTTAGRLHSEKRAATHVLIVILAMIPLFGCHPQDDETARQLTQGGDPRRGAAAIEFYGCGGCHSVPGVPNATGLVGPPLDAIADRSFLAGQLPNQPDNMMKWIRDPQQASPGSAMPDVNVSDRDARDIAAYLYTLRASQ
jgi:putative membrane protein